MQKIFFSNIKISLISMFITATFMITASDYNRARLPSEINSKYDELSPILSPDGKTLFFCREGHPKNTGIHYIRDDQDIWVSHLVNGSWSQAEHIDAAFNSKGYDGPIGTSADGKTLYVKNVYQKNGVVLPGVSRTRLINGKWTFPEKLEIKNHYNEVNLINYSMGTDEKTLIVNVKRKDTIGGIDLYVSFLQADGKWSEPKNLGPDINSRYHEVTPFIAHDMKTMYFSSSRRGGVGRYDMYMSTRLDDSWTKWSKPKNLGKKINTKYNDISYIVHPSGKYAIFSTKNRPNKKDLFSINLPKELQPSTSMLINGKVVDSQNHPQAAKIIYERISDGKVLGISNSDPKTGLFKVPLPVGEKYGLRAEKNGYLSVNQNLDLTKGYPSKNKIFTLVVKPLKAGSKIRLNNVFFASKSSSLTKDSYSELGRLVSLLKRIKTLTIEVSGHTDNIGSAKYNNKLSQKRANSVKAYILSKGIPSKRVQAKGYGFRRPFTNNKTKESRKLNRRVEFMIISL